MLKEVNEDDYDICYNNPHSFNAEYLRWMWSCALSEKKARRETMAIYDKEISDFRIANPDATNEELAHYKKRVSFSLRLRHSVTISEYDRSKHFGILWD